MLSSSRNRIALFLVVSLVLASAAGALAAQEPKFELGLLAGGGLIGRDLAGAPELARDIRPVLGFRAALNLGEHLNWFADTTFGGFDTKNPTVDVTVLTVRTGPELLLPRLGQTSRFFLSAALGWEDINYMLHAGAPPLSQEPRGFDRTFASLGFGQRICVGNGNFFRWELRADNSLSSDGINKRDLQNYQALLGWSWGLGGAPPDADGDGVSNCKDECADTPRGAVVDSKGCPKDTDGDGVFDGLDKCPDTPRGWPVDASGCPIDSDGDGVPDGGDACANTPKGAIVDSRGCPKDSDGDTVPDGIDRCAGTPRGAKVEVFGCPVDTDGDGIFDGLDKCPDSPKGVKTDADGCPIPEPKAPPLFTPEKKSLVLQGVHFDSDSAALTPGSLSVLDNVTVSLKDWPEVRIEVAGHCDSTNTDAHNLKLSQKRAEAVLNYFVSKGVAANRVIAKGYGESKPIADNKTKEGRAINRRVELAKLD